MPVQSTSCVCALARARVVLSQSRSIVYQEIIRVCVLNVGWHPLALPPGRPFPQIQAPCTTGACRWHKLQFGSSPSSWLPRWSNAATSEVNTEASTPVPSTKHERTSRVEASWSWHACSRQKLTVLWAYHQLLQSFLCQAQHQREQNRGPVRDSGL